MLADERDAILRVDGHDADGQVGEMDEAVDAGIAVRADHVVVPDGDPWVLVGDAPGPSHEAAIHRGIVAWRGSVHRAGMGRP